MNRHKTSSKWSRKVTETSDAMDLQANVFRQRSAVRIARFLKRSAENSHRRKAGRFQSAMSMLNFYINREREKLQFRKKAS